MKLHRFAIVVLAVLVPALKARGDTVWNITSLDGLGAPQTEFMIGESGFIDISVVLSGAELTADATGYQSVVSLDNGIGLTVAAPVDVLGDDIHSLAPSFVSSTSTEFVVGEFDFPTPTPPGGATNNAFRLPFTVGASAAGDYTFSVIPTAGTGSTTAWNGSIANQVFGAGSTTTISVTAVPEPTSFAVCGLVAGGLLLRRRRRRRTVA